MDRAQEGRGGADTAEKGWEPQASCTSPQPPRLADIAAQRLVVVIGMVSERLCDDARELRVLRHTGDPDPRNLIRVDLTYHGHIAVLVDELAHVGELNLEVFCPDIPNFHKPPLREARASISTSPTQRWKD